MFIARAVCGLTHVTVAALCSSCSLLCISNSDWATQNEAGRSVSVNGNESPAGEICHQYSSVVTAITLWLHTIKLQYPLLRGLLRVCAVWPTPCLNLSSELRRTGNNIQDTFPTGAPLDTRSHHTARCRNPADRQLWRRTRTYDFCSAVISPFFTFIVSLNDGFGS